MNSQFLLVISIILLGFIAKKFNVVTEKDGDSLSRIVFNFTLPAIVIDTFSTVKVDFSLIFIPIINILYGLFMVLIGYIFFRKNERSLRGMLSMVLLGLNIGFFAFPLVEAIWGKEGLKYFAMFDMGNAFIIFVVCYIVGAYFSPLDKSANISSIIKKSMRSVPLITYAITLTLSILNISYPKFILDIAAIIGRGNMPMSLLLLGVFLSFSLDKKHFKNIIKVLTLKYAAGLMLGVLLYFTLPFEPYFRFTILAGLLLPTSISPIPYSVQLGYDTKFMGTTINITIIISTLIFGIFSIVFKNIAI